MKTITAYQSEDGRLFESQADCERHEAKLDFERWYQSNRLYGSSGSSVDTEDVQDWLLSHKDHILAFLQTTS